MQPLISGNNTGIFYVMETETDENLKWVRALDKLDMLSTITDARREYLNEMRVRGVRAGPGNVCTSWRYQRSEPSNINGSSSSPFVSKEPFRQRSHSSSGLHNGFNELTTSNSGSNSHLNKLLHNRRSHHHHSRISPYGYCSIGRRRPLNNLSYGSSTGSTSTSTTSSGSTSSVSSANIEDNNGLMIASTVTSFTHFLKEHEKLQQKFLDQIKVRDVIQNTTMATTASIYAPTATVFHSNGGQEDEAKRLKAAASASVSFGAASDDTCPVPSLIRSKSLEDLRECIKPKPKSLSSYFCGNNSLDASSLSPRTNYCDLSAFHQTFQTPSVEEASLIKKEIDSMSVRIGNLDVG